MSEKVKEVILNSFGYIMVVLTSCLFILTKIFVLNPTGKTLGQIIGEGLIAFCMGLAINQFFSMQGTMNGLKDDAMVKTLTLYSKTVEGVSNNINKLADWCHDKNLITYKRERTKILARGGLRYDDCFTEEGIAKPFVFNKEFATIDKDKAKLKNKKTREAEKLRIKNLKRFNADLKEDYKYKKKCYKKAINLKLTEIYSCDLTSEGGKKNDPNYMGLTINQYMSVHSLKDIAWRLVLAIMFGVYGIELIESFSLINLVWSAFEVCIFLMFGVITMKLTYMFIINEYRGRIIKKIDNLEEFTVDLKEKETPKGEIQNDGRKEEKIAV